MALRCAIKWTVVAAFVLAASMGTASAQEAGDEFDALCQTVLARAIAVTETDCEPTARNEACYGYANVLVDYQPNIDANVFPFVISGDILPLNTVESIATEPLDLDTGTWGMSVLKFQANLPDTRPGENVTFVLFGDTHIENASGDMSAFYLTNGLGDLVCNEIPQDALLIKVPQGLEVTFNVNGVDITLGSTAILQAAPANPLSVAVVEGHGTMQVGAEQRFIPAGFRAEVPLSDDGRAPAGMPSAVQPALFDTRYTSPISALERFQPGAIPDGLYPLHLEGPIEAINTEDNTIAVYGYTVPVDGDLLSAFSVGDWVLADGYYDGAGIPTEIVAASVELDPRYMILLGGAGEPFSLSGVALGAGVGVGSSQASGSSGSGGGPGAGVTPTVPGTATTTSTATPTATSTATATPVPADTIPPVTTASRDPAWTTGKWGWDVAPPTWTLTATDEGGSGVARVEYRFGDGGDWLAYGGPITLGEGVWHLWYHAIDNAGNVESPQMVATLVDLTAPTASIADSFQGFAGEPVTLSVQASDGTSGIGIVTWSTGGSGDGLTQIAHTWDEPGAYAVSVQVQDRAGNTTSVSTTVYIESREDTGEGSEQADIEP